MTPKKLTAEELVEIRERARLPLVHQLLDHIAALEAEWPKCEKHNKPLRLSFSSMTDDFIVKSYQCPCNWAFERSPDTALAAFRAANRKTEFGGDER